MSDETLGWNVMTCVVSGLNLYTDKKRMCYSNVNRKERKNMTEKNIIKELIS